MKSILMLFAGILVFSFSCSSPSEKETEKISSCTEYSCPVHPDKTAAGQGECPECHRALVAVEEDKKIDTADGNK